MRLRKESTCARAPTGFGREGFRVSYIRVRTRLTVHFRILRAIVHTPGVHLGTPGGGDLSLSKSKFMIKFVSSFKVTLLKMIKKSMFFSENLLN